MTAVIGLDLSLTQTGIATADAVTVVRPKNNGMERLRDLRATIVKVAVDRRPAEVVIEGYSFGSHDAHSRAIGELGGVVRLSLYVAGFTVHLFPPASLKQFATGKGNAKKPDMLDHARNAGYTGSNNDNAVDAWWLYQAGLYLQGRAEVPDTAYRLKAIAKMEPLS